MKVGSALIPRFSLIAALGDRREMLTEPSALAPEPGGEQAIGEVSGAAEAFGIRAGMALSEALGRCPRLVLVPPDPGRAEAEWERSLRRLEGIGAAVESSRPGEAFFEAAGLRGLWGPRVEDVLIRAGRAVGAPSRLGAGPTRFAAYAVAANARPRRGRPPGVLSAARAPEYLDPLPVSLLRDRLAAPGAQGSAAPGSPEAERGAARLVGSLERLGVETLGELARLPKVAVADRFGGLGLRAVELAGGGDTPLRPRKPHEELVQAIGMPEAAYGTQMERALELLAERLLADPRRRGRTLRSLRIEAQLAGGGSWRAEVTLRCASSSVERLLLALGPRLAGLPAPASTLVLRAVELGEEPGMQPTLAPEPGERRREQLAEAVRQVRAAAGRDAVLRVVDVDPGSRVPERWAMLAPHMPAPGAGRRGSR
jgi:protein ImuB